jgi:hypothetical protein
MKERIKQLAELSKTPKTMMVDGVLQSVVTIDAERFAELILEDVMSICEDLGDKGMDGHYCVDAIRKKYFKNK